MPWLKICTFPQRYKVPRRKCTKYVPFNLQNSPLQCQNSVQTKVLPGRKGAEQCCGMQAIAAVKAYADHDTLDQALECAWLRPPSSSPLSASLSLSPSDSRPSYGGSRGRKGLAGGKIDNKGFKASELPTAKPLSRQWGARQPATKPSAPATSAMTEGWQNNHLNNMAESLTPTLKWGLSLQLWLVLWLACHWR